MSITIDIKSTSPGFTLIELLMAVMIISIVITSLLQIYGMNTQFFQNYETKQDTPMLATLMLGTEVECSKAARLYLDDLVKMFDIDDELRRSIKKNTVTVNCISTNQIDSSSINDLLPNAYETVGSDEIVNASATVSDQPLLLEVFNTKFSLNGESIVILRMDPE
jgi:prepilin-type N-terminal cleavage/methylation domain-containing protein